MPPTTTHLKIFRPWANKNIHDQAEDDWIHCQDCGRYFKGPTCFNLHKKTTPFGSSTCTSVGILVDTGSCHLGYIQDRKRCKSVSSVYRCNPQVACKVFAGPNTTEHFCQWLFSGESKGAIVIAHSYKGYDSLAPLPIVVGFKPIWYRYPSMGNES
jgi:hypothetical protein